MTKKEIRLKVQKRVKAMSGAEKEWASQAIIDAILSSKYIKKAKNIFIYMNMNDEPSTFDLIGVLLALEKTVSVPKLYIDDTMKPVIITSFTNFGYDKYGIQEPQKGPVSPYVDLAIIPMVAFDKNLNRLGRGKGYYDKFLKEYNCKKLGIAFDNRMVDEIPSEEHDIKMDMIITERRVIFNDGLEIKNDLFGE